MSYRLENRHCARRTKDSGEPDVVLRQRKTKTEGTEHRERG
jgi:hypothetical protein